MRSRTSAAVAVDPSHICAEVFGGRHAVSCGGRVKPMPAADWRWRGRAADHFPRTEEVKEIVDPSERPQQIEIFIVAA